MLINNSIWRKFYECDCTCEGIMAGYDYCEDGRPQINLAFFNNLPLRKENFLSFRDKLRWCWHIFVEGLPWCDMVILRQNIARELGMDLLEFANRKYIVFTAHSKHGYIGFRDKSGECENSGKRFQESCPACGQILLMCREYSGQCISSKCRQERFIDGPKTTE